MPEERPDLYASVWNQELESYLRDWVRRRQVLSRHAEPEPQDLHRGIQVARAERMREEPPPEGRAPSDMVKWNYWRDIVQSLQVLAKMCERGVAVRSADREGAGRLTDAELRDAAGTMLELVADLIRGQLHGNIHQDFLDQRGQGKPSRSLRRVEAAAQADAAARLLVEVGAYRTLGLARAEAEQAFGIGPDSLRKMFPAKLSESILVWMRERMRRQAPADGQAAWLRSRIAEAAAQYRDEEFTGGFLPKKNP